MPRSHDLLLNFASPLYISGTGEATKFKFGVQIDYKDYYQKCKITWTQRAWPMSRDLLGPLFISLERLKLQTSNLVCEVTKIGVLFKSAKLKDKAGVA